MLPTLLTAIALLFVFEGLLPFLSPRIWRKMMLQTISRPDRTIRIMGLVSLICGAVLMFLVHSGILF